MPDNATKKTDEMPEIETPVIDYGIVQRVESFLDENNVRHIRIQATPEGKYGLRCSKCGALCYLYAKPISDDRLWRMLDIGPDIVEIEGKTRRVNCRAHGCIVADVPWAYPGSLFTRKFDMAVSILAIYLPKTTVAEYMRIDWKTVGRYIQRAAPDMDPDFTNAYKYLSYIGIDEKTLSNGSQVTVLVNNVEGAIVLASHGQGKEVLKNFFRLLSLSQLHYIRSVTDDGAYWLREYIEDGSHEGDKSVDPGHVVGWAMEALREVCDELEEAAEGFYE